MRGEDPILLRITKGVKETPPHAWGRLSTQSREASILRNTPTCVGKTFEIPDQNTLWWKHPHMRGEDSLSADVSLSYSGNTPTCVGKTLRENLPHLLG